MTTESWPLVWTWRVGGFSLPFQVVQSPFPEAVTCWWWIWWWSIAGFSNKWSGGAWVLVLIRLISQEFNILSLTRVHLETEIKDWILLVVEAMALLGDAGDRDIDWICT